MEQGSSTHAPVISEWVGYWVFITYNSGPFLDTNEPAKSVVGKPEATTASFLLENYGPLGIEVRRSEDTPTIFMPWGAVMYIQGPPPDVRKQIDQEMAKRRGDSAN
ncbi:MAG: hypothetical protein ACRDSJ_17380 [Rubrobacteraceae bacterium]